MLDELATKIIGYVVKLGADEVVSSWGVQDDLKKLGDTMKMIKAVLDVAQERQAMGQADAVLTEWLRRLKNVLYRADDLFDYVFTVKHQTAYSLTQGSKLEQATKKVLLHFSKEGPVRFNSYVAGQIKSIRKELDAIKADSSLDGIKLGVTDMHDRMLSASDHLMKIGETASSVNPVNIVGRENDKSNIIDMLLSEPKPNEGSISVIPIVGMGGIGKTTLAQLVFNDDRVKNHFDITKWVWLSEKDNNEKDVIGRISMAFTGREYHSHTLESLQSSIRESIKDKKYLLVLDNVWDESRVRWLNVIDNFLSCGKRGSKIIMTTRSSSVAQNVGNFPNPYKIQLLSDDESWDLFQKVALPGNNPNLEPIGKEIVEKCGNVPLVIRAIGSVLHGRDEKEWTRFKDFQLAKINQTETRDVISLLKLSYDQLPSELKQCFSSFALLRDWDVFGDDVIICFWMSLGFVKQSSEDPEEVCQQYFRELLSRNLLLDETDEFEFRVHDLMKELAVHVLDDDYKELCVTSSFRIDDDSGKLSDGIRYLSLKFNSCNSWEAPLSFPNAAQMRYLCLGNPNPGEHVEIHRLENFLSIFISLRCLELQYLMIESVPDAVGKLRHLRFLRIDSCPITCLPNSIKKLWNLQTLILYDCKELKVLPAGISRLTNLRWFGLIGCDLLTDLPPGFGKLKSLRHLPNFIVSVNNGLDALADMKLRDYVMIDYRIWRKDAILEAKKANFKDKHLLNALTLELGHLENIQHDAVSLLQQLEPPPRLKVLEIVGYQGERLPDWMEDSLGTTLPELTKLTLDSFKRCRFLSSGFCQLPSLKHLVLSSLPELRGWCRVSLEEEDDSIDLGRRHDCEDGSAKAMFPCLEILKINECPQLISMPFAPNLKKVTGKDIDVGILAGEGLLSGCRYLTELKLTLVHDLHSLVVDGMPLLKYVEIRECRQLSSIKVESPTSIKNLEIKKCESLREIQGLHHLSSCLETLGIKECLEMNELPPNMDCLMSLGSLTIIGLEKLTALPGSIGRLIKLDCVFIGTCPELRSLPDTFNNLTQLRSLVIGECPKMIRYIESTSFSNLLLCFPLLEVLLLGFYKELKALPESIQHLSHLRHLCIVTLPEIPTWLTKLTSLRTLEIWMCPQIEERCKEPDGPDWPLVRHIPNLSFYHDSDDSDDYDDSDDSS